MLTDREAGTSFSSFWVKKFSILLSLDTREVSHLLFLKGQSPGCRFGSLLSLAVWQTHNHPQCLVSKQNQLNHRCSHITPQTFITNQPFWLCAGDSLTTTTHKDAGVLLSTCQTTQTPQPCWWYLPNNQDLLLTSKEDSTAKWHASQKSQQWACDRKVNVYKIRESEGQLD